MDKASLLNAAMLARAPGRTPVIRRSLGQALVVVGLALTMLWLGLVAWGVAILINAAI